MSESTIFVARIGLLENNFLPEMSIFAKMRSHATLSLGVSSEGESVAERSDGDGSRRQLPTL